MLYLPFEIQTYVLDFLNCTQTAGYGRSCRDGWLVVNDIRQHRLSLTIRDERQVMRSDDVYLYSRLCPLEINTKLLNMLLIYIHDLYQRFHKSTM